MNLYEGDPADCCLLALEYGFSWLSKTYDLDDQPPNPCTGTAAEMETTS